MRLDQAIFDYPRWVATTLVITHKGPVLHVRSALVRRLQPSHRVGDMFILYQEDSREFRAPEEQLRHAVYDDLSHSWRVFLPTARDPSNMLGLIQEWRPA